MKEQETSLHKFEDRLTGTLEAVIALLLFSILAIVVTLVTLRYVFDSSIIGANEIIVILFVYTTAIGAALAVGKGEHLSIVFVVEKLSGRWRRRVDFFRVFMVGAINAIAIYYSIQWISVTGNYLMPSTGLPRWVAQLSIPVGCSLALLYSMFQWHQVGQTPRHQSVGGENSENWQASSNT